jgi:hypothetical protein
MGHLPEHPDLARLQQRTVRAVAAQALGGAAIGVGVDVAVRTTAPAHPWRWRGDDRCRAAVIAAEIQSFPLLLAGMVLKGWGTAANLLAQGTGTGSSRNRKGRQS